MEGARSAFDVYTTQRPALPQQCSHLWPGHMSQYRFRAPPTCIPSCGRVSSPWLGTPVHNSEPTYTSHSGRYLGLRTRRRKRRTFDVQNGSSDLLKLQSAPPQPALKSLSRPRPRPRDAWHATQQAG
eukprot:1734863-Pleurochrysis_carterae.AAC.4